MLESKRQQTYRGDGGGYEIDEVPDATYDVVAALVVPLLPQGCGCPYKHNCPRGVGLRGVCFGKSWGV